MRRLLVLGGIASLSFAVAAIALLAGREERPASAGFCPPDFYATRGVQIWYGTLTGPGVDPDARALELTDEITENLRQQIVDDLNVDQRVRDDTLASWVVATDDATWAYGPEQDFPAEDKLRNDLTLGAPPNGTVTFGTPDREYYRTYRLGQSSSGSCMNPPYQSFIFYEATVLFYELDATFTPFTPSPTASPPPTPTAPPTPALTPTASATTPPTPTAPVTPTPTLAPSPTCQTIDDCAAGGDANCDSSVDVEDVEAVLADLGGIQAVLCPHSANVKCNDPLDALDALLIVSKKAGLTATVPGGCKPIG